MTGQQALEFADRIERVFARREAMQQWRHEYEIRLARMFGIENEIMREPVKNGLARVKQGTAFPTGSEYSAFNRLMAAYTAFSGDVNGFYIGRRVKQVAEMPTFEDALANVLNRLLWDDYGPTDYRWKDIVTSITSPRDFRENVRTGLQYVPDLPTFTEDQPLQELGTLADVQGEVTYTVNQRGGLLAISRRVLINDDVGAIVRAVEQIRRACWRTLAKRVWNLIISNSAYGVDGQNLFSAAHGNVTSGAGAALSASMLTTARNAMFAQTEMNGPDKLGLGGGPLLLVVPVAIEATAIQINRAPSLSALLTGDVGVTSNATLTPTLNEWKHRLGKDNENIFANPLLTNATDWYLFDISRNVPLIEVGFLMGQQMPRFEVADNPVADEAFTQDRIVYKVVHEYDVALLDYRGCYAGLVS